MSIDEAVLSLQDVLFGWTPGSELLRIRAFSIKRGQSVFLRGPSGSGKSTLLGLVSGVIAPDAGRIDICGQDLVRIPGSRRDVLRADHLGIIFQQFNLLPYLDVIQNVTLPCRFSKLRRDKAREMTKTVTGQAIHLAESLGLSSADISKTVSELSVGQQQRVAVARALIGGPDLIIADEPTSALDHKNRDRFIEILNDQRHRFNSSLLFVSHDETLSSHFDEALDLSDINTRAQS
ncbi:MAG: ABC transporter ATP-binding protein [Hyphomonadaceae bacterium]|nr:ABC transporter ATP-binding protein [Hyphomonadaceae bacterium]MBC6412606.1 ABC transporter ATP-binding protein [Hyphomonadaceae bacterium]